VAVAVFLVAILRVVAAVLRAFWDRFMTDVFEVRPVTLLEAVAIIQLLGLLAV